MADLRTAQRALAATQRERAELAARVTEARAGGASAGQELRGAAASYDEQSGKGAQEHELHALLQIDEAEAAEGEAAEAAGGTGAGQPPRRRTTREARARR